MSFAASVSTLLSGCNAPNLNSPSENTTETTVQSTTGGKPPWLKPSSEADIAIENQADEEVTVELETSEFSKRVTIEYRDHWISADVIENGKTLALTVSTDTGLQTTIDWTAEKNNNQVVEVDIKNDRIDSEIYVKEEV